MTQWMKMAEFADLKGKILVEIKVTEDMVTLITSEGDVYQQTHSQDCCESVTVEDICGDIQDLIGEEILLAEEVTSDMNPSDATHKEYQDSSFTWTFYKLSTNKTSVTIRWYGESNGYYSESVDFYKRDINMFRNYQHIF
jgi:hypothetical protein